MTVKKRKKTRKKLGNTKLKHTQEDIFMEKEKFTYPKVFILKASNLTNQ
jgi:hypothetical protein